jgi:hypothetical protein
MELHKEGNLRILEGDDDYIEEEKIKKIKGN